MCKYRVLWEYGKGVFNLYEGRDGEWEGVKKILWKEVVFKLSFVV